MIHFTTSKSKNSHQKLKLLQNKIKIWREKYSTGGHKKLLLLRAQYNSISAGRAAVGLLRLNQSRYDQGEKAGNILAWRIKQQQAERAINSIQDAGGAVMVDPRRLTIVIS
jgi:hypothetical protein